MPKKGFLSFFLLLFPFILSANTIHAQLDGSALNFFWTLPFIFLILSIAICPLVIPKIWHYNYGKITAIYTVLFLIGVIANFGLNVAYRIAVEAIIEEYLPFILLLFSLYTVSGGVLVWGSLRGTPRNNTILLLVGSMLASIMGTTGASVLLIRPLLRANIERKKKIHIIIFFIFLVSNIGGGLTPVGDPPLFLGFLKGVTFFWTLTNMLLPVLTCIFILLFIFYFMDKYFYKKEQNLVIEEEKHKIKIYGKFNILLIFAIVISVVLTSIWKSSISFDLLGIDINLSNIVSWLTLILISMISLIFTPKQVRSGNEFNWEPILEVAKLFLGIFISIVPIIAILKAGDNGIFKPLMDVLFDSDGHANNIRFFWITGITSSFLDNAPTYLVFFNLASGDAQQLMQYAPKTLLAISTGSVFMGLMTYIGNAPNFMVKSIVNHQGVKMPSFFGYMIWSVSILIPIFLLISYIFL